jgi:hypothetical protein
MDYAQQLVDILDHEGRITHQKPRRAVDKQTDIFHGVHVMLQTARGELVVSVIPERDELPNRYAGMLGSTMATIRRHSETAEEAARRGLRRELMIEPKHLRLLRDGMLTLADGSLNYLTAYLVEADCPNLYRTADVGELMVITPSGIDVAIMAHADQVSPTLRAIWPSVMKTSQSG